MASSYLQKYPVPETFPELLSDLTLSILREQPADIIEFSFHYFKNKVEGKSEPRAEKKNYYGDQIKKQKIENKGRVIVKRGRKPKPEEEEDIGTPDMNKTGGTDISNKTHKLAAGQFYDELTEQAMDVYENNVSPEAQTQNQGTQSQDAVEPVSTPVVPVLPVDPTPVVPTPVNPVVPTPVQPELQRLPTGHTETSNKTKKMAADQYVDELTENAMEEFEQQHSNRIHLDSEKELERSHKAIEDHEEQKKIEFQETFDRIDKNKSGYISISELENYMKEIGYPMPAEQVNRFFAIIDSDGSKLIQFDEFYPFFKDIIESAGDFSWLPEEIRHQKIFNMLDVNNSQTISVSELAAGLKKLNFNVTDQDVEELMKSITVNTSGLLTFDDFHSFFSKLKGVGRIHPFTEEERHQQLFCLLDETNQGFLSESILATSLTKYGVEMTDAHVKHILKTVDHDNSGLITNQQFKQIIKKVEIRMYCAKLDNARRHEKIFKMLDSKNSGSFAQTEITVGMKAKAFDITDEDVKEIMTIIEHDSSAMVTPEIFGKFLTIYEALKSTPYLLENEKREKLFTVLDANKSGFVSQMELGAGLRKYGFSFTDAKVDNLLKTVQYDGSGLVTKDMFIKLMEAYSKQKPQNPDEPEVPKEAEIDNILKHTFSRYDYDRSGYLEKDELRTIIIEISIDFDFPPISDKEIDTIFKTYDVNKDKRFSLEEFKSFAVPFLNTVMEKYKISLEALKQSSGLYKKELDVKVLKAVDTLFGNYDLNYTDLLEKHEIVILIHDFADFLGYKRVPPQKIPDLINKFGKTHKNKWTKSELSEFVDPHFRKIIRDMEAGLRSDIQPIQSPVALENFDLKKFKEEIDSKFQEIDEKESGFLEYDQIRQLYLSQSKHMKILTKPELDEFISLFDKNADQRFDKDEAYDLMIPAAIAYEEEQIEGRPPNSQRRMEIITDVEINAALEKNFLRFDQDNSNYLEKDEIRQLVDSVFMTLRIPLLSEEDLNKFINNFDADNDKKFDRKESFLFLKPAIERIKKEEYRIKRIKEIRAAQKETEENKVAEEKKETEVKKEPEAKKETELKKEPEVKKETAEEKKEPEAKKEPEVKKETAEEKKETELKKEPEVEKEAEVKKE